MREEERHSGLGIASFIISIAAGVLLFLLFVVAGVMEVTTPGGIDEESASAVVVGLFMFAFCGIEVIALGLGVAGLMQQGRRKLFAVLGVLFAASALVGTALLMLLGLAVS